MQKALDVITIGEAMAMFVATETGELAEVEHFMKRVAGAELNVATGLARLGLSVEQRQPAPGRFIRRYGAKLRMVRLSRLYMNIADGRRQVAGGLFRRVANP